MKKKLLLSATLCFVCYLLIPFLSLRFAEMAGFAICLLLFFTADPLVCAIIGILAGTEPRCLWWMPFAAAAAMPLCFSLCVLDFIPELFIYSVGYLAIGLITMVIAWFVCKRKKVHHDGA